METSNRMLAELALYACAGLKIILFECWLHRHAGEIYLVVISRRAHRWINFPARSTHRTEENDFSGRYNTHWKCHYTNIKLPLSSRAHEGNEKSCALQLNSLTSKPRPEFNRIFVKIRVFLNLQSISIQCLYQSWANLHPAAWETETLSGHQYWVFDVFINLDKLHPAAW